MSRSRRTESAPEREEHASSQVRSRKRPRRISGRGRIYLEGGSTTPWFLRWWVLTPAVLVLLVAAGPWIASTSLFRGRILASAFSDVYGSVQATGVTWGWFSPVVIHRLEVRDEQGELVLRVDRLELKRTLWQLWSNPDDLGPVRLVKPEVNLHLTRNSSNLEKVFAAYLEEEASETRTRATIELLGGTINLSTEQGDQWQLENLDLKTTVPRQGQPWRLEGEAQVVDATGGGSLEWALESRSYPVFDKESSGKLTLSGESVPLSLVELVLKRYRPELRLSGLASGRLVLSWKEGEPHPLAAESDLRLEGLRLEGPWAQGERLELEQLTLPCRLAWDGRTLVLSGLKLNSDAGQVNLQGTLLVDTAQGVLPGLVRALQTQQYRLKATADVARLARMFPRTIGLKRDLRITSGQVGVELEHSVRNKEQLWRGRVTTTQLKAVHEDKVIAWDEPVQVDFAARATPQGLVLEQLDCQADFLDLEAEGDPEYLSLAAAFDLDRLWFQLGRFFQHGNARLQGDGWVYITWERKDGGGFEADFQFQVRNFEVALETFAPWQEENLVGNSNVQGTLQEGKLGMVRSATLEVESQGDQVRAKLIRPTPWSRLRTTWPLEVELQGDLPRWQDRLEHFWPQLAAFDLEGKTRLKARLDWNARGLKLHQGTLAVDRLAVRNRSFQYRTGKLELKAAADWKRTLRRVAFSQLELKTDAGTWQAQSATWFVSTTRPMELVAEGQGRCELPELLQEWGLEPQADSWHLAGAWQGDWQLKASAMRVDGKLKGQFQDVRLFEKDRLRWSEAQLPAELHAQWQSGQSQLRLSRVQLATQAGSFQATGVLGWEEQPPLLALEGTTQLDLQRLVQELLGPQAPVQVAAANRPRSFRLRMPLGLPQRTDAQQPLWAQYLETVELETTLDWSGIKAYGFPVGPAGVQLQLEQGVLRSSRVDTTVGSGRLSLQAELALRRPGPVLSLAPGVVLQQVEVMPEMSARGLKYIAPVLAQATRVSGRFSLEVSGSRLRLDDMKQSEMAGRLFVHQMELGPSPLLRQLAAVVDLVRQAAGRPSRYAAGLNLVRLRRESVVPYRLVNGKMYHRDLVLDFGDVVVTTYGAVGLDESIAIMARVEAPQLFARSPVLRVLAARGLEVPLSGTLSRPKLDRKQLEKQLQVSAQGAVGRAAEEGLQRLLNQFNQQLERLIRPR